MMSNNKIKNLVSKMTLVKGANRETINQAGEKLGTNFPDDYVNFMLFSNGAYGEIGKEYIIIWSIEELLQSNEDMQVNLFAPGLIAFGGDGGNEIYAFNTRDENMPVVQVPMIGMSLKDIWACGNTFEEFLILKSKGQ